MGGTHLPEMIPARWYRRFPSEKTRPPNPAFLQIATRLHPGPTFPPVTGLYRPIFGTQSARFSSFGAHFTLPSKHATDILANVTENVYRKWSSEAEMAPDGRYSPGRCVSDGN